MEPLPGGSFASIFEQPPILSCPYAQGAGQQHFTLGRAFIFSSPPAGNPEKFFQAPRSAPAYRVRVILSGIVYDKSDLSRKG